MANSATLPFEALETRRSNIRATATDGEGALEGERSLSRLGLHEPALVHRIELDSDLAAWVRAVGIREGETLVVLRKAAFGGPLHVRTSSGGEFALNRSLAHDIVTKPLGRARANREAAE